MAQWQNTCHICIKPVFNSPNTKMNKTNGKSMEMKFIWGPLCQASCQVTCSSSKILLAYVLLITVEQKFRNVKSFTAGGHHPRAVWLQRPLFFYPPTQQHRGTSCGLPAYSLFFRSLLVRQILLKVTHILPLIETPRKAVFPLIVFLFEESPAFTQGRKPLMPVDIQWILSKT